MSPRKKIVRCCHFDVKKLKILLKKCWLHGIIRTMKTIALLLFYITIFQNIITLTEQVKQQGGSLWSLS
ncbi:hypothetical protein TH62_10625 [Bacillus sp. TH008]|nr:hypothetical protein TH62_10625 [Bacillus sp. TH008]